MSNLAEKLPKSVQTKLSEVEEHGRKLAKRIDEWVETNVPNSVTEPLRSEDGVNLQSIKTAATAATEELVSHLRAKWDVIIGGKDDEKEVEVPETKAPVAKTPAAKTPAAKTPAAKTPAAKKTPAARKTTTRKAPARKKSAAKKASTTAKAKTATPRKSAPAKVATKSTRTKKTTTAKKNSNTSKAATS